MMPNAARRGDLGTVKHLVQRGMFANISDPYCRIALHWAAEWGHYEIVKHLISSKCDLNLKDRAGNTPVLLAAAAEKKEVVDFLLECGAKANYANGYKCTLLHFAAGNGWADVVSLLLRTKGVDLNATNRDGQTPLMCAVRKGHTDVAAILLGAGADVNRRDCTWKWTELHWAVEGNHTAMVKELLGDRRVDLNPQDMIGETPLHKACKNKHLRVLRQLLEAGADVHVKSKRSHSPLCVGIGSGNLGPAEIGLFVQHGFVFDNFSYEQMLQEDELRENVLNNVDLCTQAIVNKFHCQSLPILKASNFAKWLPCIDKFKLNARQIEDIEDFVRRDIEANTYCNIVKARPMVITVMCIESLVAYLVRS